MKQEKTAFCFQLSKELSKEWRAYILKKYSGYYKGVFTEEVEAALRLAMDEYSRVGK